MNIFAWCPFWVIRDAILFYTLRICYKRMWTITVDIILQEILNLSSEISHTILYVKAFKEETMFVQIKLSTPHNLPSLQHYCNPAETWILKLLTINGSSNPDTWKQWHKIQGQFFNTKVKFLQLFDLMNRQFKILLPWTLWLHEHCEHPISSF